MTWLLKFGLLSCCCSKVEEAVQQDPRTVAAALVPKLCALTDSAAVWC